MRGALQYKRCNIGDFAGWQEFTTNKQRLPSGKGCRVRPDFNEYRILQTQCDQPAPQAATDTPALLLLNHKLEDWPRADAAFAFPRPPVE